VRDLGEEPGQGERPNRDDVIRYIRGCDDEAELRQLMSLIQARLRELREQARRWTEDDVLTFWTASNDRQKMLIRFMANRRGTTFLSDVKRELGWKGTTVGPVIGGINNRARRLGFRDVIKVEWVRRNGEWDAKYTLDEDFLRAVRAVL